MTGNKNAWRAPLAGLASVAMIATMGVAASTANAAAEVADYNFTVTFNANGGQVNGKSVDTFKTADNPSFKGELGYNSADYSLEGYKATKKLERFTGWYTAAEGGEKFNPSTFVNADLTLYAHFAEPDDLYVITFDGKGEVDTDADPDNGDVQNTKTIEVAGKDQKIAAWELPVDIPNDQKALTGWSTNKGDAVSSDELTTNFVDKLNYDRYHADKVTLTPVTTEDAVTIAYDYDADDIVDKYVDAAFGSKIEYPEGYTAVGAKQNTRVLTWTDEDQGGRKGFDTVSKSNYPVWHLKGETWQKAYKATYYTEIAGKDRKFAETIVDEGNTAAAPTAPSRNEGYTFAMYTEPAKPDTDHVYSDTAANPTFYKDHSLVAQWSVKNAKVTFDYSYGNKSTEKYYEAGDVFTTPTASEVTRDNWTLLGWYVKSDGTSPFADNREAEFQWTTDTFGQPVTKSLNNGVHSIGWYDANFKLPENAKLKIGEDGVLYYQKTAATGSVDGASGKPVYKTEWVPTAGTLYAAWKKADVEQLNSQYDRIPTQNADGSYIKGDKQSDWKPESYDAYQSAMAEYREAKAEAEKDGINAAELKALQQQLSDAQAKLVQTAPVKVYRLYNKWNGDHVYTTSQDESSALSKLGWKAEGVQFNVTEKNPLGLSTAVYRLYNPYNGEHLLTADKTEAAGLAEAGWVFDKSGSLVDEDGNPVYFYAPQGATTGVTRLFNPYETVGTHLYTTSSDEIAKNVKLGWIQENVLFNVVK
ncbi:InlB B-repeat-containing protein [Bifidobacterium oedipodis]|uniref:Listeria-Bacteroides repeat domain n=1 Tax=Bifidobacterium oedipodis TaxID=2675322 RepID=A0A7Y0HUB2_9BIFI|nr:InlB B-repeat-containing protein [Bifidobacterium sp. DSM 109957]NMM94997.1 Listeria-Bacteroides repeat domain [Bifidobacterium sp. DSM 109957]